MLVSDYPATRTSGLGDSTGAFLETGPEPRGQGGADLRAGAVGQLRGWGHSSPAQVWLALGVTAWCSSAGCRAGQIVEPGLWEGQDAGGRGLPRVTAAPGMKRVMHSIRTDRRHGR